MLSPPVDELEREREQPHQPPRRSQPQPPLTRQARRWSKARVHRRRRRVLAVLMVFSVLFLWVAVSLGSALTNPALGNSYGARAAEWLRGHGGSSLVVWAENEWYSHHPPKVGGSLPRGTIRAPKKAVAPPPAAATVQHLPAPGPIVPLASPPVAGEGQWSPVGRRVDGLPAVYETMLRPSAIHTSYVVGVAWMDTTLLKATLYSGSLIPGGGPYSHTAPVSPSDATSLVAGFNAGFLMSDAQGGYYTDGKTIVPLRTGAASFVVYKNGSSTVGQWGRDVSMGSDVVAVRQNLDLLVDGGRVVPAAYTANPTQWGRTLGGGDFVWRSGVGVTADGALVYVGGPGLDIADLANILVRAGAVRAMELDINTDWVNFSTYQPSTAAGAASAANGTELLSGMTGTPGRYFEPWWARDFITMSADTAASTGTAK